MKKNGRNGFTLLEMLIVIIIIVILLAVAVPVIAKQIEKTRETADIANMRNARGVITSAYMLDELEAGSLSVYYYAGGQITSSVPSEGYGKGTGADGKTVYDPGNGCELCAYDAGSDNKGDILVMTVGLDETIHVHWADSVLPIEKALPKLDPNWVSWTMTDSRGLGGRDARENVLNALGLSDRHEYTFTTTKDGSGTYIVYIYSGNFPDAAKKSNTAGKNDLKEWMEQKTVKDIMVSVYTYDPATQTTTYNGQREANAVLRERSDGSWIQIQPK